MSSSRNSSRLPREDLARLDEVRARECVNYFDLDHLLQGLDPERFEDQLQELIVQLGNKRLVADVQNPSSKTTSSGKTWTFPVSGRISRRYIKDIENYQTMTRQEEVAFSKRMEFTSARLAAAEFASRSIRSARLAEYQRVRQEFVERNLHLVVAEAYAYRTYGLPLDDLIQEGNTALMRAVEKFDWRHNVRFRTYVAYWVRQAVERYIAAQKGAVRVPHHLQQKMRRLKREGLIPKDGEEATVRQIARAFEVDQSSAGHLIESSRPSLSLDQEITPDGDRYRDLLVEDWEPKDSERGKRLSNRISHLLEDLDDRELKVLRMRFGLDGREEHTLEEVGRALSLSRERSRQIQQRALCKLRHRAKTSHLEDYL